MLVLYTDFKDSGILPFRKVHPGESDCVFVK